MEVDGAAGSSSGAGAPNTSEAELDMTEADNAAAPRRTAASREARVEPMAPTTAKQASASPRYLRSNVTAVATARTAVGGREATTTAGASRAAVAAAAAAATVSATVDAASFI
ncbi:hypothetical protein I4F81_012461 [Pyropia yezoensis]|uniref:Uncharacterized protein n=1 Tax=Pyropia yezoensis TaxID=2788 RepID=A0ACC3CJQ5_PYRYE|nr:hypothetical protein I4F81_012461 [Neopyropia yezoensis]